MICYAKGSILDARAEALVNTVNEVGVMGKGVALLFRETFPDNARAYEKACRAGEVRVGRMFVTENAALIGPRWIINFPTKKDWRQPSRIEWIQEGLTDLVRVIREKAIASVALPPLGCGNGGLNWDTVRREIEAAAARLPDVEFIVYEASPEYRTAPRAKGVTQLTPARALLVELVRRYDSHGMACSVLEVQKLAWFLHRTITRSKLPDPLGLEFVPHRYGPYADRLRHLLDKLDGSYLHCQRCLAGAAPGDMIWFDEANASALEEYLHEEPAARYLPALDQTTHIVEGFESPLGLELLATVDWLLAIEGTEPNLAAVKAGLAKWTGGRDAAARKMRLFDDRLLSLALERLTSVSNGADDAAAVSDHALPEACV